MPDVEVSQLNQDAVLWMAIGRDIYGQPVVSNEPRQLKVQWNNVRQEALDAKGNTISIDAIVVTDVDIKVGSVMWLGKIDDLVGTSPAQPVQDAMQVQTFNATLDLKGRATRRTAKLMRFRDTLPIQSVDILPPPPPPPPAPTGMLPVFSTSQLTVLGYMLSPRTIDPLTANNQWYLYAAGGMTCYVADSGKRRFYITGGNSQYYTPAAGQLNNGEQLIEIEETSWSPTVAGAIRASFVGVTRRAAIYGSNPGFPIPYQIGQSSFDGINLYWEYFNQYNVTASDYPTLGYSVRNGDGTWTPYGAFYVGPGVAQGSKKVSAYSFLAPAYFAKQYLGGNRLLAGAGQQSGNDNCSRGPGIWSVQMPGPSQPLNTPLTSTPLMFFPKAGGMARDTYYSCPGVDLLGADWTVRLPQTLSSDQDWFGTSPTAVWLRSNTHEGVLIAGNVAAPGCVTWYGNAQYPAPGNGQPVLLDPDQPGVRGSHAGYFDASNPVGDVRIPRCAIFDPADLALVMLGQKDPSTIVPTQVFDPRGAPFGFSQIPHQEAIGGMCADPVDPTIFYVNITDAYDSGLPLFAKVQLA
jgi:hypothetical protein